LSICSSCKYASTLIGQVQNLRIEEAKRLLETGSAFEETAAAVGCENRAFFRRLFRRDRPHARPVPEDVPPLAAAAELPASIAPAAA